MTVSHMKKRSIDFGISVAHVLRCALVIMVQSKCPEFL